MAKSIRLSRSYRTGGGEFLSPSDLKIIGEAIESGRPFLFDSREIASLLDEKRLLDQGLSSIDKARIVLFLLVLLVPAAIGIAALFL
jgi:hypothetical protein